MYRTFLTLMYHLFLKLYREYISSSLCRWNVYLFLQNEPEQDLGLTNLPLDETSVDGPCHSVHHVVDFHYENVKVINICKRECLKKLHKPEPLIKTFVGFPWSTLWIQTRRSKVRAWGNNMGRTYCSFRSVNCFSRVVISSRHSILLLSQSSSSISVHIKTWQVWLASPKHQLLFFSTTVIITAPLYYTIFPGQNISLFSTTAAYLV